MNHLRTLRTTAGLTQMKLAAKAHLSQPKLQQIEWGCVVPWPHEAQALAAIFDTTPEAIFPEGRKVRCDYGKTTKEEWCYMPPEDEAPPRRPRAYPRRPFMVLCWKCRAKVTMVGGNSSPHDDDPRCPACGAAFGDIVPLEEMTL